MAGETPDYGRFNAEATVFPVTDLGELAARLGSPITHDRRGDVVWWEDFEWTLNKWEAVTAGTGAAAAISAVRARNGRCSALLTAGSDGGQISEIFRVAPFPILSRFGFEYSFALGSAIGSLDIIANVFDGVNVTAFVVRWDDAANTLAYLNAAAAFTVFASGVGLSQEPTLFHTAKLVYDGVNAEYVRFLLDSEEYDISGIGGDVAVDASLPAMVVAPLLIGRAGSNDTVYVDDAIMTINEPA